MTPEEYLAKALSIREETVYNNPNATITIGEAVMIMRGYAEDYHRSLINQKTPDQPGYKYAQLQKEPTREDVIKSLSIETTASYSGPISNGIAMENHPGMKE